MAAFLSSPSGMHPWVKPLVTSKLYRSTLGIPSKVEADGRDVCVANDILQM